ncbi:MAG: hypothetical protein U0Q15_17400 [Kineosporiaceae bacterium]
MQGPPSRAELRGQDAAVAAFREAVEQRRAAAAAGPWADVAPFPDPRSAASGRGASRRLRARLLGAAGPLTAAAAVVAAALAVPMLTGLFDDSGHPSATVEPVATAAVAPVQPSATAPAPTVPGPSPTTSPTSTPSPSSTAGARGGYDGRGSVVVPPAPQAGEGRPPGAVSTSPSSSAEPGQAEADRGMQCRTWLLVRPGTAQGERLLDALSTRPRKGHAPDVAAVDHLCKGLVGQDPPRCRADGSIDPAALRAGRSAWRQVPLYADWCQAVTGVATQRCSTRGECPQPWWRCPSWGCQSVRPAAVVSRAAATQGRQGSAGGAARADGSGSA